MKEELVWSCIKDYCLLFLLLWLLVYLIVKLYAGRFRVKSFYGFLVISAVVYIVLFLFVTLLGRGFMEYRSYELSFLWEYRLAFGMKDGIPRIQSREWVGQIRDNILLFVPMGVLYGELAVGLIRHSVKRGLLFRKSWRNALFTGFLISAGVETAQLVFRLGMFEFDDMLNNTIGMLAGYGYFVFCNILYKKWR